MSETAENVNTIELATELTIAWLNNPNNRTGAEDVPAFLQKMHQTLGDLSEGGTIEQSADQREYVPAVSVRKSLASQDYIISMIDGKQYRSLRRHLTRHGLTPEQYRERYGLKPDYPMVAPSYAAQRRDLALKIGLGQRGRAARAAKAAAEKAPARKGTARTKRAGSA